MTKIELIKALEPDDDDAIIVLSTGEGWANIGEIKRGGITVSLIMERHPIFSDS